MLLRQKKEMGWDVPMITGGDANHQDLVDRRSRKPLLVTSSWSPPLPQDMGYRRS